LEQAVETERFGGNLALKAATNDILGIAVETVPGTVREVIRTGICGWTRVVVHGLNCRETGRATEKEACAGKCAAIVRLNFSAVVATTGRVILSVKCIGTQAGVCRRTCEVTLKATSTAACAETGQAQISLGHDPKSAVDFGLVPSPAGNAETVFGVR
jgi:hypothetical protein